MINKGGLMKLIRPDKKYIQSYIEANEEDEIFRPNAERRFRNHETIIESSYNLEHGINLPINYVLSLIHISEPTRPY